MDSSQPAWRVFDTPGSGDSSTGAGDRATPKRDAGAPPASPLDLRIALAGVAGAFGIGALAFALLAGESGEGAPTIDGPGVATASLTTESFGAGRGELVIDVAGAVANPGLYHLDPGARVGDAIDAAGGFGPRVDVERVGAELNLAATLTDGQQVRVPSRDDPVVPAGGGGGAGPGAGSGAGAGGLVNLNTASASELDTLPGIGPVTAAKILESRATQPFTTVQELRERGLVGEKTFESLKALVTVG
jgi:competence protein ComEA